MAERIVQLGLQQCPVCNATESLGVRRWPVISHIGGLDRKPGDQEVNILFLVAVECQLCGYVMHFNSERFTGTDETTMIVGLTDEEEDALEDDQ